MHLFFVMRATENQKQTTKLQTQERTPQNQTFKVLGYVINIKYNYFSHREIAQTCEQRYQVTHV